MNEETNPVVAPEVATPVEVVEAPVEVVEAPVETAPVAVEAEVVPATE